MKQFWQKNKFVLLAFSGWMLLLQLVAWLSYLIPMRTGYIGAIPWGNFDGIHYVHIAQSGYFQYSQAFFPVYPLLMGFLGRILPFSYEMIGVGISLSSFLIGLLMLYRLLLKKSTDLARYTILFLLLFPTSFFFHTVYTEGLFFLCIVLTLYFTDKKNFLAAGVVIGIAGAIRIVGVCLALYVFFEYIKGKPKKILASDVLGFLLMPLGLIAYMFYLWKQNNDPLLFLHVQSAFGANRSSSKMISLPQVVWRYLKMMVTAYLQPTVMSYIVTVFEFVMTALSYLVIWFGRKKISIGWVVYSLVVLTVPTLTGTFSSMPRYMLAAVPLFIILGSIKSTLVKVALLSLSAIFEIMATALFLRGWFIA